MKNLSDVEWTQNLNQKTYAAQSTYYGMYSSWHGGVTMNPHLMMVPVDDHLVHRGDGVFEAFKIIEGKAYLWREHFARLCNSADAIGIKLPMTEGELFEVICQTFSLCSEKHSINSSIVRLYISRGPGTFSPNPYDSIGSQVYMIMTELKSPKASLYDHGASAGLSKIEPKSSSWARLKTCNYLPNVLMKKESVDRGLDFTIGIDSSGTLTEGSTENFMIVDEIGRLLKPKDSGILKGTMMTRAIDLVQQNIQGLVFAEVDITLEMLLRSQELMMVGTTLDVLPVTSFDGKTIGTGRPGPIAQKIYQLLKQDQQIGPCLSVLS